MDLSGREIRIRAAEVYNGSSVPARATGFKLGLADVQDKRGFVDSDDVGGLPLPYDRRADDLAMFGTISPRRCSRRCASPSRASPPVPSVALT